MTLFDTSELIKNEDVYIQGVDPKVSFVGIKITCHGMDQVTEMEKLMNEMSANGIGLPLVELQNTPLVKNRIHLIAVVPKFQTFAAILLQEQGKPTSEILAKAKQYIKDNAEIIRKTKSDLPQIVYHGDRFYILYSTKLYKEKSPMAAFGPETLLKLIDAVQEPPKGFLSNFTKQFRNVAQLEELYASIVAAEREERRNPKPKDKISRKEVRKFLELYLEPAFGNVEDLLEGSQAFWGKYPEGDLSVVGLLLGYEHKLSNYMIITVTQEEEKSSNLIRYMAKTLIEAAKESGYEFVKVRVRRADKGMRKLFAGLGFEHDKKVKKFFDGHDAVDMVLNFN